MAILSPPHHLKKLTSTTTKKKSNTRILITIKVLGSTGPIRLLVGDEEPVAAVIRSALRVYAREGRLPVLGADHRDFFLYSADVDGALGHLEAIGSQYGSRSFLLCKKVVGDQLRRKGSGNWKAWFNRSLNNLITISSH